MSYKMNKLNLRANLKELFLLDKIYNQIKLKNKEFSTMAKQLDKQFLRAD